MPSILETVADLEEGAEGASSKPRSGFRPCLTVSSGGIDSVVFCL